MINFWLIYFKNIFLIIIINIANIITTILLSKIKIKDLLAKIIAIYIDKKISNYCQNYNWDSKLLFIKQNEKKNYISYIK